MKLRKITFASGSFSEKDMQSRVTKDSATYVHRTKFMVNPHQFMCLKLPFLDARKHLKSKMFNIPVTKVKQL